MSILSSIQRLYRADASLADNLLRPQRWCHRQWRDLRPSSGSWGDMMILALKVVALVGITTVSYAIGIIGLGAKMYGTQRSSHVQNFSLPTVQGSGIVELRNFNVTGNITTIQLKRGNIRIVQGNEPSLTLSAENNIIPLLTVDVQGNQLTLGCRSNIMIHETLPIQYTLTIPVIKEIKLSGLGDIEIPELTGENFSCEISGSGKVILEKGRFLQRHVIDISGSGNYRASNLTADNFDVFMSGSGDVAIANGLVQNQEINISGSGSYKAPQLISEKAQLTIVGAGEAIIRANRTLDVNIKGSGCCHYYSNPTVTRSISGIGEIRKLGD